MHRLMLLRHAKSSWDDFSLADHDRPLARRGRDAAAGLGEHLRDTGPRPDLVVCSTSRRTRQTLERLGLDDVETRFDGAVYGATAEELLTLVRGLPESAATVLVVGHNPGMGELADRLCGQDQGADAQRIRSKFPTAALAVFDVSGTWSELADDSARLRGYRTAR